MMIQPPECGVIAYEDLRPSLDVFVVTWVGDSLLSRVVRHFAPGGSHSSLGLNLYGSLFLIEALELGVSIKRVSERFDDYVGDILIHPIPVAPGISDAIKATALKMCGSAMRYGYLSLVRRIWGTFRNSMRRPICSQTVSYILSKHGVLPPQDMVLSPGELRALLPAPWRLAPYSKEAD